MINFTCFELCQVRALSQDDLINLKSDFLEIIIYEQRLLVSIYSSTCLPCTFPHFPIFFQKPKYNLEKLTVDIWTFHIHALNLFQIFSSVIFPLSMECESNINNSWNWFSACYRKPAILLKKRLWHRCFPVNIVKFLRTPFLQKTSGRLLLLLELTQILDSSDLVFHQSVFKNERLNWP